MGLATKSETGGGLRVLHCVWAHGTVAVSQKWRPMTGVRSPKILSWKHKRRHADALAKTLKVEKSARKIGF